MSPAVFCLLLLTLSAGAAELTLTAPSDYHIVQRDRCGAGKITLSGVLEGRAGEEVIETRLTGAGEWQPAAATFTGKGFTAEISVPSGGWFKLEVRAVAGGRPVAEAFVPRVGAGEIFLVAGQSNAANHGEERQQPRSGKTVTFDGRRWRPAGDPQPGASGEGGSFLPPFGDALVERFQVPVGFIACGIGATSVREWLPKGDGFPGPPTITSRVESLPDGTWRSKGEAFAVLASRLKAMGPGGFRAVLWHQGESDANQRDAARTLPGPLYREFLGRVIRESRREAGWEVPWFVAQVSYHVPGDESSPEIRGAQAALWRDGVALEGPDSDALKGDFRENHGQGVHFSGPGLREHAARWVAKVAPWLAQQPGVPVRP